ncbi:MAG: hypothetical protein KGQ46_05765 [Hyphomicrobiales bacterium]|nr:hypothetical protein [Hyphomicrobiales bacterium]MDE2115673.1 hypothetical protein [Hyphomicrobiales bacterium]
MNASEISIQGRVAKIAAGIGLVGLLAGCNSVSGPGGTFASMTSPHRVELPDGKGCDGQVARYRAIIANDLTIGQVNTKVAVKIDHEIDQADHACQAGDSGRSMAIIRASRVRYGYPPV